MYEANPNEKALKAGFIKCYQNLNEGIGHFKGKKSSYLETGMVVIIHTKFLFVAPIIRPYASIRDQDIYPDALAFMGVFTLPVLKK